MRQFHICLHSFRQVQEFVKLAMGQPFEVSVGNDHQDINGKDIMGMSSLDYRYPQRVMCICTEEEFCSFHRAADAILTN